MEKHGYDTKYYGFAAVYGGPTITQEFGIQIFLRHPVLDAQRSVTPTLRWYALWHTESRTWHRPTHASEFPVVVTSISNQQTIVTELWSFSAVWSFKSVHISHTSEWETQRCWISVQLSHKDYQNQTSKWVISKKNVLGRKVELSRSAHAPTFLKPQQGKIKAFRLCVRKISEQSKAQYRSV